MWTSCSYPNFLSLRWEHLVANTCLWSKLTPPCCTLHDNFPETLTSIFFKNSSESRQEIHTVPKHFKFPLATTGSCYCLEQISTCLEDSGRKAPPKWEEYTSASLESTGHPRNQPDTAFSWTVLDWNTMSWNCTPDSSDRSSPPSSTEEVSKKFQIVFKWATLHTHKRIFNISSHKTCSDQQKAGDLNGNTREGPCQGNVHLPLASPLKPPASSVPAHCGAWELPVTKYWQLRSSRASALPQAPECLWNLHLQSQLPPSEHSPGSCQSHEAGQMENSPASKVLFSKLSPDSVLLLRFSCELRHTTVQPPQAFSQLLQLS